MERIWVPVTDKEYDVDYTIYDDGVYVRSIWSDPYLPDQVSIEEDPQIKIDGVYDPSTGDVIKVTEIEMKQIKEIIIDLYWKEILE